MPKTLKSFWVARGCDYTLELCARALKTIEGSADKSTRVDGISNSSKRDVEPLSPFQPLGQLPVDCSSEDAGFDSLYRGRYQENGTCLFLQCTTIDNSHYSAKNMKIGVSINCYVTVIA